MAEALLPGACWCTGPDTAAGRTSALMGWSKALVCTSLPSVSIMMPTENLQQQAVSEAAGQAAGAADGIRQAAQSPLQGLGRTSRRGSHSLFQGL